MPTFSDYLPPPNALVQAARAGRYADPSRSGYSPSAPTEPEQADQPQPEQSLASKAGSASLNLLSAAGNALDLPGSVVRDFATWLPGGTKAQNPFDQLLDPFGKNADKNRIEGRTLLRDHGLVGRKDNWGNFIGGIAAEMALDPTTYLGLGVANRIGKAFEATGLTKGLRTTVKEMAERAGKNSKNIGTWTGKYKLTGQRLLDHVAGLRDDAIAKIDQGMPGKFKKSADGVTFKSADDLAELSKEKLKDGQWALVDDGTEYSGYKWKANEDGTDGKWLKDADLTDKMNNLLSQKSIKQTHRRAVDGVRAYYKSKYGEDGLEEALKNTPMYSMVSFQVPFAPGTMKPLKQLDDPNASFDDWIKRQDDLPKKKEVEFPDVVDEADDSLSPQMTKIPDKAPDAAPAQATPPTPEQPTTPAPDVPVAGATGGVTTVDAQSGANQGARATAFTTEKGSTYEVNGQSTKRNKSLHKNHDPNDVGPKDPSDITYYVNEQGANQIGMIGQVQGARRSVIVRDGHAIPVTWNEKEGRWGVSPLDRENPIKLETEPSEGLFLFR